LDEIPPGEYFLLARKPGFIDRLYGARIHSNSGIPIGVHAGEVVKGVAVNMLRGAVIAGTVVDEDGEPFTNVSVRALQYKFFRNGKRLVVVDSTTTNDHGEYRVHALLPGNYLVACSSGREHPIKDSGTTSIGRYPVTFYPSVTSIDNAVATPVKAAEEAIVNVTLTATKGFTVRGKVAGNDPGAKSTIMMSPVLSSGNQPLVLLVGEDNSFEMKAVAPGNYRLSGLGMVSKAPATGSRKITIEDHDLSDVLVTLENSRPPIAGTIRTNGRADRTRLLVHLVPGTSDNEDEDSIMSSNPKRGTGSPLPDFVGRFTAAVLDRDATPVFATIEPQAAGYEDWYVASVLRNGEDVTNSGFDPKSGGSLAITFNDDGGIVQGAVIAQDGQAIPGGTVVLIPEDTRRQRRDLFRFTRTDQHGEFTMRGIAPGDYKLVAWQADIEIDAIYDADYMKPYLSLSNAESLKVNARSKYRVALSGISDEVDQAAK
jgi:protocatechuate 3,4-dioxygenase beta subunit